MQEKMGKDSAVLNNFVGLVLLIKIISNYIFYQYITIVL